MLAAEALTEGAGKFAQQIREPLHQALRKLSFNPMCSLSTGCGRVNKETKSPTCEKLRIPVPPCSVEAEKEDGEEEDGERALLGPVVPKGRSPHTPRSSDRPQPRCPPRPPAATDAATPTAPSPLPTAPRKRIPANVGSDPSLARTQPAPARSPQLSPAARAGRAAGLRPAGEKRGGEGWQPPGGSPGAVGGRLVCEALRYRAAHTRAVTHARSHAHTLTQHTQILCALTSGPKEAVKTERRRGKMGRRRGSYLVMLASPVPAAATAAACPLSAAAATSSRCSLSASRRPI